MELLAWQGQHGWGGGPWIGIVWAAVLAAVIIGGIYLLRRRPNPPTGGSAEAVLAARYARGDIDDEEYRERLEVLRETKS